MRLWEEFAYERMEAREEGFAEGRAEGDTLRVISIIRKMHSNNYSPSEISDLLDKPENDIENILLLIAQHSDWDDKKIYDELPKDTD